MPICKAQRLSAGMNLFLPARYESKGYEFSLSVDKPYSALSANLSYGWVRDYKKYSGNFSGNFFNASLLINDGDFDNNTIQFQIGAIFSYSKQHDVYHYSFGKNEFNQLIVDQKNLNYFGYGFIGGVRFLEDKPIWFDGLFSLQKVQLIDGPDNLINHYVFGMGSQNTKKLTTFEPLRIRFQFNIHVRLFEKEEADKPEDEIKPE